MTKNVLIVALLVVNLVLVTAVIFNAMAPPAAYGQVATSGKYVMVSGQYLTDRDALYLIDLARRRLAVIEVDPTAGLNNLRLRPLAFTDLQNDFRPR